MWHFNLGRRHHSAPRPDAPRRPARDAADMRIQYPVTPNGMFGQLLPACEEDALLGQRNRPSA